jgi:type I restriction-modification system DNA methylase subunit
MNKEIQHIIDSTYNEFLHTSLAQYDFVDIILSLVSWGWLSAYVETRESDINYTTKGLHSPGPAFHLDLKMVNSKNRDLKYEFEQATNMWERENPTLLKELLYIDPSRLKYIPFERWNKICSLWANFFDKSNFDIRKSRENMLLIFDSLDSFLPAQTQMETSEVFTPREVADLMIQFFGDKRNSSIYDPHCKAGDLLSLAATKLEGAKMIKGSTQSNFSWKWANLRILMIDSSAIISIRKGFALSQAANSEKFDTILLNPPFGIVNNGLGIQDSSGEWSVLFNKTNRIDIAYLCHALDHLADDGQIAVIVPNILLSGQALIKGLRTKILNDNLLDAVITLPARIFYNTGVSAAILFLSKIRKSDKVFMLDASGMSYKKGKQFHLDAEKVNELFNRRKEQAPENDERIRFVTVEAIVENDYDLQFSVYGNQENTFFNNMARSEDLLKECHQLEEELIKVQAQIKITIADKYNIIPQSDMHNGPDKD